MIELIKIFGFTFLAGVIITFLKNFKQPVTSWPVAILQNFLGSLLIFSGVVKAIDPLGTAYKMKDYFDAFSSFTGTSFAWLSNMSVSLAVFMIVLEVVLGVALIIGYRKKITLSLTAAMMIFFTVLTGFTYLTGFINPDFYDIIKRQELKAAGETVKVWTAFDERQMKVTDCGCFGDFLKLVPKHSFFKDIFLMVVIIVLFIGNHHIKPFFGKTFTAVKIAGSAAFFLLFCLYNFVWNLPLVDFRPYKIGNNIPKQMTAERKAIIEYKFIYKNKNTGELLELSQDELKGLDYSVLEYVDRKEKVIDPGIPAKINNFGAYTEEGYDMTEEILSNPDFSLWVLSKSLKKSDLKAWKKLSALGDFADEKGLEMFAFMTSSFADADEFRHEHQAAFPFYQADETFIKTVVRANPGLVLLKEGNVMGKWHHKHIPTPEQMQQYINALQ
jgi:uncharacterized membrane protein YphA (DoxX/SURF4 family)